METKEKISISKYIELAGLITGGISVMYTFIVEHFKLELLLPIIIFLMIILGITIYKRQYFKKQFLILVIILNLVLQISAITLYFIKNKVENTCEQISTKYGICICKFDNVKTDDFSYLLNDDLINKKISAYNGEVNSVDTFITAAQINNISTFNYLIKSSCYKKGLLVFGRRSENSKLFICTIFINSELIKDLNTIECKNKSGEIIKLKNPTNFTFNIDKQSDFISDFILGLFQLISKKYNYSSQTFERLLNNLNTTDSINTQTLAILLANSKAYENKISETDSIYNILKLTAKDSIFIYNLKKLSNSNIQNSEPVTGNLNTENFNIINNSSTIQTKTPQQVDLKPISTTVNSVQIGKQFWTTENLNVTNFNNGDPIPEAKTNAEWIQASNNKQPAWCYYNNDPNNSKTFGKLYNWYAINDPRGIAPQGWNIPNDAEWKILIDYIGGRKIGGVRLKSEPSNGSNSTHFNAQLGGWRLEDGKFATKGLNGYWWSSTSSRIGYASHNSVSFGSAEIENYNVNANKGLSVRCVKINNSFTNSITINSIPQNTTNTLVKDNFNIPITHVTIGKQIWMSSNLNVDKFSNGDIIPEAKTAKDWENALRMMKPAWCYYMNDPKNNAVYGKLYNYYAIIDKRGLAPNSWRIPKVSDWNILYNYLGTSIAAQKLKSKNGWEKNGNGTNSSMFNASPGGCRINGGAFKDIGKFGYWWALNDNNLNKVFLYYLGSHNSELLNSTPYTEEGMSVRCVK